MAVDVRCSKCVALLAAKDLGREAYSVALPNIAALGDVNVVRLMLDRGANVNAVDPLGRTPLMYAAASDLLPLDEVKLLVERGADINAKDTHKLSGDSGLTVLDYRQAARRNAGRRMVGQIRRQGHRPKPARSQVAAGEHHPKRDPGKSSIDSAS